MDTVELNLIYGRLHKAAGHIISTGKELEPMLVSVRGGGEVRAGRLEFPKQLWPHAQKMVSEIPGVVASILINEAWKLAQDRKTAEKSPIPDDISDHPDRTECVVFNFLLPNGRQYIGFCDIDRTTNSLSMGDLMLVGSPDSEVTFEGRMVHNSGTAGATHH